MNRHRKDDVNGYYLLYHQYARPMYNTALRIVNSTAEAEEILRESFTEAFNSPGGLGNRPVFDSWLKKTVIQKSIAKVKRGRKKWAEVDLAYIEDYALQDEPEADETAFSFGVENVKQAIAQLPDGFRTVLCLRLVENYAEQDIAVMLGIAPATVRTQYLRAKKKLLAIIRKNDAA